MRSHQSKRPVLAISAIVAILTIVLPTDDLKSVGLVDLPRDEPEDVGMSSDRLQRIDSTMQRYIDSNQLAGTVTLIARHGKVVHVSAQGWRHKEANKPMTPDTIFTIMSMTKPIVSTALMMLYEEGYFLLDDPISKWLPAYENMQVSLNPAPPGRPTEPAIRPVTVRHVLTHTSGLSLQPNFRPDYLRLPAQDAVERPRTVGEAIDHAADVPLAFHPGDDWQYGASTDYVALLVEKISGMNVQDFLEKRLFQPLGMEDTHYNVPQSKIDRVAAVYQHTGQTTVSSFSVRRSTLSRIPITVVWPD